jgi:heptosyltransferase-2
VNRLMVLAPNWLGDAILALPAIADLRRGLPRAEIIVAARPPIAPLFQLVPEADRTITVAAAAGLRTAANELGREQCEAALLLRNSMRAALLAALAGIPERWGYRAYLRGALLTRAVIRPAGLHQAEYYQQLVHALGFPNGPMEPNIVVPPGVQAAAADVLRSAGWNGGTPLVAMAPGAAYGGAKRWPAERFAELAGSLAADDVQTVMIGTAADRPAAADVHRAFAGERPPLLSLVGRTDVPTLAGVLAVCRALVTNDSGAMHLGAAVGTSVIAVFGPTDERATRPLGDRHEIVTLPVWCRPCMLRECPLDHQCMRGIDAAAVLDAVCVRVRSGARGPRERPRGPHGADFAPRGG